MKTKTNKNIKAKPKAKERILRHGDRIFVCKERMGFRWVNVFIIIGLNGASFCLAPGDGSEPFIELGFDGESVIKTMVYLHHEVYEGVMADTECRYIPDCFENKATDIVSSGWIIASSQKSQQGLDTLSKKTREPITKELNKIKRQLNKIAKKS